MSSFGNTYDSRDEMIETIGARITIWNVNRPPYIESLQTIPFGSNLASTIHFLRYPDTRSKFLVIFKDEDEFNKRNILFRRNSVYIRCQIPEYNSRDIIESLRFLNKEEVTGFDEYYKQTYNKETIFGYNVVPGANEGEVCAKLFAFHEESQEVVPFDEELIFTESDGYIHWTLKTCPCIELEYIDCYEDCGKLANKPEFIKFINDHYFINANGSDPFYYEPAEFYKLMGTGVPFEFIKEFKPYNHVFEISKVYARQNDMSLVKPLFVSSEIV
mgnify:CR=1 FL=1